MYVCMCMYVHADHSNTPQTQKLHSSIVSVVFLCFALDYTKKKGRIQTIVFSFKNQILCVSFQESVAYIQGLQGLLKSFLYINYVKESSVPWSAIEDHG